MCLKGTARISIYTITRRAVEIGLVVLLASSPSAWAMHSDPPSSLALRQDVDRLGLPGNDDFADVGRLAKSPAESAGLLVSQLSVLQHPERTIVGNGTTRQNHALWIILALRYITGGMDFCAPTKWKFSNAYEQQIRKYWLYFYNKSCVIFFSDWPSRGRTYVAPLDAQEAIIRAWREWYARQGKTYRYKPLVHAESRQWPEGIQKLVRVEH